MINLVAEVHLIGAKLLNVGISFAILYLKESSMTMSVKLALTLLALLSTVACGKVEVVDNPPATPYEDGPEAFGQNLSFKFSFNFLPVDPNVDPQISTCHRQLKDVISRSQFINKSNVVRLIYDMEKLFSNNKIVGNLSAESRNFFIDDLVPNLASPTADFVTQFEIQGHAQRTKGVAFAYSGKVIGGQFQKSCSIPLQFNYQFVNN